MVEKQAFRLSPSKLNLLEDCPRCFWLDAVQGIKRPAGPMASIAIKMDSIIKHYFDRYREQNKLPPIIEEKVKGKLPKNMPKTLYCKESAAIALMGRPDDYLELEDGCIVALDHKTKSKAALSILLHKKRGCFSCRKPTTTKEAEKNQNA